MVRPNTLGFPLDKMPNVNKVDLFAGMREITSFRSVIYYCVDSKYRKIVSVRDWLQVWADTEPEMDLPNFGVPSDQCALDCTRWVAQTIKYTGDVDLWKINERWSLPSETLGLKQGDCEDGALLLYWLLRKHGFDDNQVRVIAGDVRGGGHAYVSYISMEDAREFVLDWCYWPADSLRIPYGANSNYFYGQKEWFAFNLSGAYKRK